jgi:PAS domain S-box-containing protein
VNDSPIIPTNSLGEVRNLRGWAEPRDAPKRSSADVLQGLPAEMLLNRLDVATIVIGFDGVVVYANPACERLLGYQTALTLEGQLVNALLADQPDTTARGCVEMLRNPDRVTNWNHSDGYPVAALASDPMLVYATAMMLMVSLKDLNDRKGAVADTANRVPI